MARNPGMFAPLNNDRRSLQRQPVQPGWTVVSPVPRTSTEPPEAHPRLGKPSQIWTYRNAREEVLGHVWRIDQRDGEKDYLPLTWCRHDRTGKQEWRFKSWVVPRPLYQLNLLAKQPDARVVVCEGEKAADSIALLLEICVGVTSPGGSKAAAKADWSALKGRHVFIWPDRDDAGAQFAQDAAAALHRTGAASIQIVTPPIGDSDGWDAADAKSEGWSINQAEELLQAALPYNAPCDLDLDRGKAPPQRDRMLKLFDDVDVWHDEFGDVYATLKVDQHHENWPLRSSQARRWIRYEFNRRFGDTLGGQALEDAIGLLEARGAVVGPCYETRRRVGAHGDAIYVDLCDDTWRAVRVRPNGWDVVQSAPVKFLRSGAMRRLPIPVAGESIDTLRGFLNVSTDDDFCLAVSWLIAALRPDGPYPLAIISGEQGSGKSNFSKVLRALVDPNAAPVRTPPRDERDLIVCAVHSHVQAFDNLSSVPAWLADGLCRLATGGGFSARAMYTNADEQVITATRPSILNGIPNLAERPDLADRAVSLSLDAIRETDRRAETEFWREFAEQRPLILGALMDGLSAGLRRQGKIKLSKLPRMADFALWVEQCAPGLGWEDGAFLRAYGTNRADISAGAFEADPLAGIVKKVMDERPHGWEGTATQLLQLVNDAVPESQRKSRFWPSSASAMGSRLRRVAPLLRRVGLETETSHSGTRIIRFVWATSRYAFTDPNKQNPGDRQMKIDVAP